MSTSADAKRFDRAFQLHQQGRLEEARFEYQEVLRLQPLHFDALHLLGAIAIQKKNPTRAIELIGKALSVNQQSAAAYVNHGIALSQLNRLEAAAESFDKALALNPNRADALFNRGYVLGKLAQHADAAASYERAVSIDPNYADAHRNHCTELLELGRYPAALASADLAIGLKPGGAESHNNRGIALIGLGRYEESIASFNRVIAIDGNYADAYRNRGNVLLTLLRYEEAVTSFDRAIALTPDNAQAHHHRGNALIGLRKFGPAIDSISRSIDLNRENPDAYCNRGYAQFMLGQCDAAIADFDRTIALDPNNDKAYNNRGCAYFKLKKYQLAIADFDRVLLLNPDFQFFYGMRLHAKMQICDWSGHERELGELARRIELGLAATPAFPLLALSVSAPLLRKAAKIWVREEYPPSGALGPLPKRARHDKIRVGYFSADFCFHPVSLLTAELFETHSRERFEFTAFSFGPNTGDAMLARLRPAFDHFIDVRSRTDQEIAALAREREIDIAVDLTGFTEGGRPRIFSMRAAPLQVGYIGFLGTMSADYMDYLIADSTIVPPAHRAHYSEKIAYLPSYQANDSTRLIADRRFTREELGLPPSGFVFCCFNASYKITPGTFEGWMRILKRVPGGVLFLLGGNDEVKTNLGHEAARHGVDPSRLVFGKWLPVPEYLARYRSADLFLDTLPYNAGTTASDALWAGLPVLTCLGETFAGRVAASLLNALELPELIATTAAQYEDMAVALAMEPARLSLIKQRLADHRLSKPLFDTPLFTRNLESAFTMMYDRYQSELPPEHLHVEGG